MKIISNKTLIKLSEQLLEDLSDRKEFPQNQISILLQGLRWDPRLCEITINYFAKNWRKINPVELNSINITQETPATLAIILEHVSKFKIKTDKFLYRNWMKIVLHDCPLAKNEQFFINVYPFASSMIRKNAETPLKIFSKWGFFERSLLLNKADQHKQDHTEASIEIRKNAFKKLIQTKQEFTLNDYLSEVEIPLSRRQAERDLKHYLASEPRVKKKGHTRGRRYEVR